ncbi:MAG: phage protein NinX family protein [Vibrio toranzoniae]
MTTNYDDMSDFEINKRVFRYSRDFGKCEDAMKLKNPNRSGFMWGDGANWFEFNPCNNPSDAWPIIAGNGVSIDFWGEFWGADIQRDCEIAFEHEDKNPLRAAMVCLLKSKEFENG